MCAVTLTGDLGPSGVTDQEYLFELAYALGASSGMSAAALSSSERNVLRRHSGVKLPADALGGAARSWLSNVTSNLAEQLQSSLTVAEVTTLLQISGPRISHRVHERGLYALKASHQLL
jgi:hypothetical protein